MLQNGTERVDNYLEMSFIYASAFRWLKIGTKVASGWLNSVAVEEKLLLNGGIYGLGKCRQCYGNIG